jgi:hypothetical protein
LDPLNIHLLDSSIGVNKSYWFSFEMPPPMCDKAASCLVEHTL